MQELFGSCGTVMRVDLKNGFAFIEYSAESEAGEATKTLDGKSLHERKLTVEAARGSKRFKNGPQMTRRRGMYRVRVEGLDTRTSWQDLKDFARDGGGGQVAFVDVYSDRGRKYGMLEYNSYTDMTESVKRLDETKCDGVRVRLVPLSRSRSRSRSGSKRVASRSGSRSPSPGKARSRSASPARTDAVLKPESAGSREGSPAAASEGQREPSPQD